MKNRLSEPCFGSGLKGILHGNCMEETLVVVRGSLKTRLLSCLQDFSRSFSWEAQDKFKVAQ